MNIPHPCLELAFWRLVLMTVRLKRRHRAQGAAYTDHLKTFYDPQVNPFIAASGDAFAAIRPLVRDMAGLRAGERVLDVATGQGHQAAAFGQAGHPAVGVDYVYDRVARAAAHQPRHNLGWCVADGARLPFPADAFDVAVLTLGLHDMPQPVQVRALAELGRVARRRVVVAEPRPPEGWLRRQLYAAAGELVDESVHFREFALQPFEQTIAQSGLRLRHWRRCYHDLLAIYVCDPPAAPGVSQAGPVGQSAVAPA